MYNDVKDINDISHTRYLEQVLLPHFFLVNFSLDLNMHTKRGFLQKKGIVQAFQSYS